ncbi:hypothetical protein [Paenibacillus sp. J2TS4]|uniref:hypothetical protein n=1 Tax=Paenibacillus sp. J2TS4 TaxID=2807194 RepID=UPI001B064766|nr:hypothetical protein [Paenibacillus sp. J2TS4]GIP34244.1 hypothetical protein J2TS4_34540 [Paenibacillus sp. J2TS4]
MTLVVGTRVVKKISMRYCHGSNEYIEEIVNQGVKVRHLDVFLSFKFNQNEAHIYKGNRHEIKEFYHLTYTQMFPKSFLNQFIDINEVLPIRLKRWARSDYLNYIYEEIIQSLIFHRISASINDKNMVEWEWKSAGVKMLMAHDFTFCRVELN